MCVSKQAIRAKGFTLLELLIIVAVVSVLAAIAIPLYNNVRVEASDTVAKSDLRNAMTALDLYFIDNPNYPATSADLLASGFSLSKDVSFTKYKRETMANGNPTVHMHVQHAGSPNAWHANYPKEGTEIQIR